MPAEAVPDTQLGLGPEELALLHQAQANIHQTSSSSSRAASRASSQGLLLLDPHSLASLARYFDRLMSSVEHNIRHLSEQAQMFTQLQYDRAGNLIAGADEEIARYHQILRQLDELEMDFDRIASVREIVRGFRSRMEQMERELEASSSSSSRHRSSKHGHGHGHHRHGHGHSSSSHRHRH